MNHRITIPNQLADQIRSDCQLRYPEEACGLLLGDEQSVHEIIICENAWSSAKDRDHRFTIDPLVMLKAEQNASANKMRIIGTYHSHPDHEAVPSKYDLEVAWPIYVYLILEVRSKLVTDMKAWQLNEKNMQFQNVLIEYPY